MSAKHDLVTATLSADDIYARENGWVELDGTLTSYGRGALQQFLYEKNKTELVQATKDARKKLREIVEGNYADERPAATRATASN